MKSVTIQIEKNPEGGVVAIIGGDRGFLQKFQDRRDAIAYFEKLAARRYMMISWDASATDPSAATGRYV